MIEFILMIVGKKDFFYWGLILSLIFIIWNNNILNLDVNYKIENNKIRNEIKAKDSSEVKLIRVVDGDTVILNIDGVSERVRLVGINTPETKKVNGREVECFGVEAAVKAKEFFKNKKVYFEKNERSTCDRYGRLLGYVFLENTESGKRENFAEIMIASGYAYEYTYRGQKYKYQDIFKKAQRDAQENKLGLWADGVCK